MMKKFNRILNFYSELILTLMTNRGKIIELKANKKNLTLFFNFYT